jgi:hypothetical protein
VDEDELLVPFLVGLRAGDVKMQALRLGVQVGERGRRDFTTPHRARPTQQQNRMVAQALQLRGTRSAECNTFAGPQPAQVVLAILADELALDEGDGSTLMLVSDRAHGVKEPMLVDLFF